MPNSPARQGDPAKPSIRLPICLATPSSHDACEMKTSIAFGRIFRFTRAAMRRSLHGQGGARNCRVGLAVEPFRLLEGVVDALERGFMRYDAAERAYLPRVR
jgi:hypothetical protein